MEKANITLYTVIGDPGRIETAIREHFKEMTKEFTPENGNPGIERLYRSVRKTEISS